MSLTARVRRLHRFLGAVVGLQILLWTASGMYGDPVRLSLNSRLLRISLVRNLRAKRFRISFLDKQKRSVFYIHSDLFYVFRLTYLIHRSCTGVSLFG